MLKILIDRNIERDAITHRTVMVPKTVQWGDREITQDVMARQRIELGPTHAFRIEQVPYLATIGVLARAKQIELFTSFELNMERIRQFGDAAGWADFSVLDDTPIGMVDVPVDRDIIFAPFGGSRGVTKKEQIEFFKSITDVRFLELRHWIGDGHIDDAFHLWSAECAKLDRMLTLDRRFWNQANAVAGKFPCPVKIVTPKELCDELGQEPADIDALAASKPAFH